MRTFEINIDYPMHSGEKTEEEKVVTIEMTDNRDVRYCPRQLYACPVCAEWIRIEIGNESFVPVCDDCKTRYRTVDICQNCLSDGWLDDGPCLECEQKGWRESK